MNIDWNDNDTRIVDWAFHTVPCFICLMEMCNPVQYVSTTCLICLDSRVNWPRLLADIFTKSFATYVRNQKASHERPLIVGVPGSSRTGASRSVTILPGSMLRPLATSWTWSGLFPPPLRCQKTFIEERVTNHHLTIPMAPNSLKSFLFPGQPRVNHQQHSRAFRGAAPPAWCPIWTTPSSCSSRVPECRPYERDQQCLLPTKLVSNVSDSRISTSLKINLFTWS